MQNIKKIAGALRQLKTDKDVCLMLQELLTQSEINVLSKRWCILNMLNQGVTQREIAQKLNVSLCKVTRGAKILKNKNAIVTQFLEKDKTNDTGNLQQSAEPRGIFRSLRRTIHKL